MWSCVNCQEPIDDQFDACWQCGCTREGKLNLNFAPEKPVNTDGEQESLKQHFAESFVCRRCKHREARIERISTTGPGLAQMLKKDFLAISCENCGLTEFYNLSVLEGRTDLQNFLRELFGM